MPPNPNLAGFRCDGHTIVRCPVHQTHYDICSFYHSAPPNYVPDNDTDGFANGTVTVNYDADTEATDCIMYWGDGNGNKLEGYDAFAAFKLDQDATVTKSRMNANVYIPEGAKQLLADASNGSTESQQAAVAARKTTTRLCRFIRRFSATRWSPAPTRVCIAPSATMIGWRISLTTSAHSWEMQTIASIRPARSTTTSG